MNNIKTRTINNKLTYYTANNGQPVGNINSVSFEDIPDTVFTVTIKDGEYYVHLPQRSMNLVKLQDVIEKYEYIVYKVS